MTIKQLTYLVEIANTNSFTVAAKNLGVTQGQISHAIKELEKELGFKVFDRTSKKINITKQGYLVLGEARKMLSCLSNIHSIKKTFTGNSLKIRTFDFTPIITAFRKFVEKVGETKNTHLSLKISEYNEIISGVLNGECDLGVLVFPYNSKHGKQKYLDEDLLEIITLTKQQMYVKLRNDHPLARKGNIFNELNKYKLIHFRNESFYPSTSNEQFFIDNNNTIYLNDKETRYKVVASTNAYMIGMSQTKYYKEKYDLLEVPIKDQIVEIVYFYKKGENLNSYAHQYIEFLEKEMKTL